MPDNLYHVRVLHGPRCPGGRMRSCRAAEGDVLIDTWQSTRASFDMEVSVTKARVEDPEDHAGSFIAWGPDA